MRCNVRGMGPQRWPSAGAFLQTLPAQLPRSSLVLFTSAAMGPAPLRLLGRAAAARRGGGPAAGLRRGSLATQAGRRGSLAEGGRVPDERPLVSLPGGLMLTRGNLFWLAIGASSLIWIYDMALEKEKEAALLAAEEVRRWREAPPPRVPDV
ncbi:hypothetical protein ABPG75_010739 [Micractinium tetrahymenae]